MKIPPPPVEPSCYMRTDGQTWRKLTVAFLKFANAPKQTDKCTGRYNLHVLISSSVLHVQQFYLIVFYNYLYDTLVNREYNQSYMIPTHDCHCILAITTLKMAK